MRHIGLAANPWVCCRFYKAPDLSLVFAHLLKTPLIPTRDYVCRTGSTKRGN